MMYKPNAWQCAALTFAVAISATGCAEQAEVPSAQAMPAKSVDAISIQPRPFSLTSELPGRVEPIRVAEVRARVPGIVLKRAFTEGMVVEAGRVLFQIDPAPFKAALSRARSELARTEAQLAEAQAVFSRYGQLLETEAVSRQDFDTARTTLETAKAARQAALAEVETANLNLGYATVTAPISGRVGRALVTEGALVGQNEATPLATIQQIDRVYVDFKQPVAEALRLRAALGDGKLARAADQEARIAAIVEGTGQRREGTLLFSDIAVDRNTGQVSLRGEFDNADGLLLPGMYVRVQTSLATDPNAILVPQRAVYRGGDGKPFVLTVGKDGAAQARPVTTGKVQAGDWHITSGLKAGDRVIVNGQAREGDKVSIAQHSAAAPANGRN